MLTALLSDIWERDFVSPQRMNRRLRLPLAELAELARIHRNTLAQRPDSPLVQKSLEPVVRILAAAEQLTGDPDRAIIWFRRQPIAEWLIRDPVPWSIPTSGRSSRDSANVPLAGTARKLR